MSDTTLLSQLRVPDNFRNRELLTRYLAGQLYAGRVCLVLGAGVSVGCGLPEWDKLTQDVALDCGVTPPVGMRNEQLAEHIRLSKRLSDVDFAQIVRKALYAGADTSFEALRRLGLLAALGALVMVSSRGSVRRVVSFNYDDLLERYLRFHGFDVESVANVPCWARHADIVVDHPHGLLPNDGSRITRGIVFTQLDYDRIVGREGDVWRRRILETVLGTTCVFIGLSGNDQNLTSILAEVAPTHPAIAKDNLAYWGVRLSDDPTDPFKTAWEGRGVAHFAVRDYPQDLPAFLFEVCQLAALKRREVSQP